MDKIDADATLLRNCLESLDLDRLAEEAGWSAKSRKVTALGWCVSLCLACATRAPSLRVAATVMGLVNALTVSKQALHGRLLAGGGKLVEKALGAALALKAAGSGKGLAGFARVLVQDSTCLSLPASLKGSYPGSSNQHRGSAVMRIQAVYDMVAGAFVEFALGPYTRNDQAAAADILETLGKGDLVLRDLGYLTLDSLRRICESGAYYLSRYMNGHKLLDPVTGEELDLAKLVRSDRTVEVDLLLGAKARLRTRLIAIPLKEEVANRRRQKARSARDLRLNPSKRALHLLGWQIMLTNCPKDLLPAARTFELYSMRWRIETIFKSWKSGLGIDSMPTHASKGTIDAIVHAALLRVTLVHAVVIPWLEARDPTRKVSVTKLMGLISISAGLVGPDRAANENLLENLSKHSRYERRKRRSLPERWDKLVEEMENLT